MLLRRSSSGVELLKNNDVILKYFNFKSMNESRSSYHTQKSDLQTYHRLHNKIWEIMIKKEIPRNSKLPHTIAQITHLTAHNEFWEIMSKK